MVAPASKRSGRPTGKKKRRTSMANAAATTGESRDMPQDMVEQILNRLSIFKARRLGRVNKTWAAAARYSIQSRSTGQVPYVLFRRSNSKVCHLLTPYDSEHARGPAPTPPRITKELGTIVLNSSHGWLFLLNEKNSELSLLNPLTMDRLNLPSSPRSDLIRTIWMSSPPTSPSCRVLALSGFFAYLCKPGEKEWFAPRKLGLHHDYVEHIIPIERKFYGITARGWMFVFEDKPFRKVEIDMPRAPKGGFWNCKRSLVEFEGSILHVHAFYEKNMIKKVEMVRMSLSEKQWIPVTSLKNHSLFLGGSRGYAELVPASGGLRGNCIYFIPSCGREAPWHVYDIENSRIIECQNSRGYKLDKVWLTPSFT